MESSNFETPFLSKVVYLACLTISVMKSFNSTSYAEILSRLLQSSELFLHIKNLA